MIIIKNPSLSENTKSRNLILTILLSIFILSDVYLIKSTLDSNPNNDQLDLTQNINLIYLTLTFFDLFFTYFIFRWKKWAFWGTVGISFITFLVNLYNETEILFCLLGLSGILLLYAALQLKSKNISGWNNLE